MRFGTSLATGREGQANPGYSILTERGYGRGRHDGPRYTCQPDISVRGIAAMIASVFRDRATLWTDKCRSYRP